MLQAFVFPPIVRYVGDMSFAQRLAPARPASLRPFRYVARQPIIDRDEKVFGYELLFRNGVENCFSGNADEASRSTLDTSLLMGLDILCDGRRAFVNCTRDTLTKGLVTLLPAATTVVEILETIRADRETLAACRTLKDQGYLIALDDYVAGDAREPFAPLADIIKVEMQLTTEEQRAKLIKQFSPWHCRMLAEKIETQADFLRAREQGFIFFQGYFFRRPETLSTRDMPANQLNYLRLLQEVSRPELDLARLEKLVKAEASVCYRLLRYLNSAAFGFRKEIHSVKHALSLLGEKDARRWVLLVAAVGAGQDKTSDLVLSALVRGRFGELLSPRVPHGDSDLFLVGLLSLIDAMLEMSMASVLEKIALDQETKAVLLGRPSALSSIFQLMLAHESGDWESAAALCECLHLNPEAVAQDYWEAQRWARELSLG